MTERTKTGLEILKVAAIVGVFGNVLLRVTPWGLNAFLFVTIFTAGMILLMVRRRPELLTLRSLALQGTMVFFGAMFLIRDSIELRVADTIAIIIIMGVLALSNFGVNQRIAGIFHYVAGSIWAGLSSLFAPLVLLGADVDWRTMPGNRLSRSIFSVLRGLAIALPLVMIFGALFMAADAAFENFANRAINFELDTVISHVMLTSFLAWLTAGYFRGSLVENFVPSIPVDPAVSPTPKEGETNDASVSNESSFVDRFAVEPVEDSSLPDNATVLEHINRSDPPEAPNAADVPSMPQKKKRDWQNWDNTSFPQVFTLGTVETVIILGLVDLLFLTFVIIQVPYLFGGMELVQNTPDFKLAEYARRGFGELVAVAALVLPMLLVSHWLLRRDNVRNELIFKILAGIQVGLLFVIMASAMQRLILLTGELGYGMTTVRFYPMVFMIWLGVVFAWFGLTVLRGRRNNFAWGALWSAIVVLGATNLLNPDAFIVKTNIALAEQGRDFDAYYNSRLSDDAVPLLITSFDALRTDDQQMVISRIAQRYCAMKDERDLRSWNYSRWSAKTLLESNKELILEIGDCRARGRRSYAEAGD